MWGWLVPAGDVLVLGGWRGWQHDRRDLLPASLSTSGLLAVGNANGRLAVLGPAGDVIWSMMVAKRIETEMAWIDDRTVLAGTTAALVAFRLPLP
jgi:hypothetical protein